MPSAFGVPRLPNSRRQCATNTTAIKSIWHVSSTLSGNVFPFFFSLFLLAVSNFSFFPFFVFATVWECHRIPWNLIFCFLFCLFILFFSNSFNLKVPPNTVEFDTRFVYFLLCDSQIFLTAPGGAVETWQFHALGLIIRRDYREISINRKNLFQRNESVVKTSYKDLMKYFNFYSNYR